MDSPVSDANPDAVSDVSIKDVEEEKRSPSVDPTQSNEDEAVPPEPEQPSDDLPVEIRDQDREYGCKYCDKKFSNKQALGGHQNAHKIERTLEKNVQENSLGYFAASSPPQFLSSYHRSHDFLNRSCVSWPYPSQGIHIGYSSRPGPPMGGGAYGPRPLPGFDNVYSGWSPPLPRIPHQFPGYNPYMPNHGPNLGFSAIGEGSSGSRPVSDGGLSAFAGPSGIRPDGNPGDANLVRRMNDPGNQQVDDSGLDLTLKL